MCRPPPLKTKTLRSGHPEGPGPRLCVLVEQWRGLRSPVSLNLPFYFAFIILTSCLSGRFLKSLLAGPECPAAWKLSGCPSILVTYRLTNPFTPSPSRQTTHVRRLPSHFRSAPSSKHPPQGTGRGSASQGLTSAAPGFCDQGRAGGFQSGPALAASEAGFLVTWLHLARYSSGLHTEGKVETRRHGLQKWLTRL